VFAHVADCFALGSDDRVLDLGCGPGHDECEPASRALLAVSYLDSLHAQRGIDDSTRGRAEFFRERATEGFHELRARWTG
jgi:hypothetical protein